MKRTITLLSLIFIFVSAVSFAQEAVKTTPAKPKTSGAELLVDKNWKIVSVEEWGVVTKPPADRNKNDMLNLTADGKFNLMMHGVQRSGTWIKSGQYIQFTDEAKKKFGYKIVSSTATNLKVDHFSDEEGHSIFEFEVK